MLAHLIDAILVLVPVEAAALILLYRRTGRGIAPRRLLATIAAGFFIMLAVRLAIAQAGDGPIAACLLASFFAHIADLAGRWRGDR